jgi:uncharacterized protein YukE
VLFYYEEVEITMNGDLNFMVSTEGLHDKGKDLSQESKKIKEALKDIDDARKALEGWISKNKERYDNKVGKGIPKMYEMTEVIDSFSGVAIQTSERAVAVENKIAAAIENDDVAA